MKPVFLSARCTSSAVTVFWDKPEAAKATAMYEVSLKGKPIVRTDKTHVTFAGLTPDTEYTVDVQGIGSIRARTAPARHPLIRGGGELLDRTRADVFRR